MTRAAVERLSISPWAAHADITKSSDTQTSASFSQRPGLTLSCVTQGCSNIASCLILLNSAAPQGPT